MMKKVYLIVFFVGLLFTQCTEKYPKEINRPEYGLQNSKALEIDKVLLTDSATILYIDAYFRPKSWIRIDSATYLLADGKKYVVESSDGIDLHAEHFMPESGEDHFTLTFPPLPKGTKSFDFIESDCDDCFKIWDVNITGKSKKDTPDIPSDVLNAKINTEISLPEPQFKTGKTKVTLHLSGLKEGYAMNRVLLVVDNIFIGDRDDVEAVKESEGKYVFNINQYATASALLVVGNSVHNLYLNPGEEADVYLDLAAESKYNSRYNPQKELKYIVYKGELSDINNQITDLNNKIEDFRLSTYGDTTVVDMTKEQYFNNLFERYNNKLTAMDTLGLTPVQRQIAENNLKCNLIQPFQELSGMYLTSYWAKNKMQWGTKVDYTPPTLEKEDLHRLKELNLDDPKLLYSLSYSYSIVNFVSNTPIENLSAVTGSDTGLLQDLGRTSEIIRKATSMQTLTPDEEKVLASTSSPYYGEVYKTIYDNTKKAYEEALAKGGFVIEETPKAASDKVLDAIIAKYKGKAVFVDFWATWCGPCLNAMKTIKPIKPEMAEKGVVSIYITGPSSPKAKWTGMLSDIGVIHYYLDEKQWTDLSAKYDMRGIPTYMIFDKDGKKTYQQSGYPGNDKVKEELSKVW